MAPTAPRADAPRGLTVLALLALAAPAARGDEGPGLRFVPPEFPLPALKSLTLTPPDDPGPGAAAHRPLAAVTEYARTLKLPGEGPYAVWWQPREGKAIPLLRDVRAEDDAVREVRLADHLGVVRVRGRDLPRAEFLVLTPPDDPGPDEQGHAPVQTARDYRQEMAVPPGFYAVWMKPANGSRAQRIERKVRVLPGKVLDLD
ncbi:MAG TPA: hypothetical protein VIL46_08635 [Gemmataceae bacterium]